MKQLLLILLTLFLLQQAFSQTETFDIATYTPPKDWKKDTKQGVVNYSTANTTTGTFCIIALYASTASTGDADQDFKKDWEELVVTPFKAEANPKTETQTTAEGWKVVTGAAPIKLDGNDLYIILTVASGFGKTMSIRTSLNDPSYSAQVDALFNTIKLAKIKTSSMGNKTTTPGPTAGTTGKFGLMLYTAPAGWNHQVFPDGIVFKPLDLPADEHLSMQIMQPLNFSGTLDQAVQQSYDEAVAMYNGSKMNYAGEGNYKKTEPKKSFMGWDYVRANGGVRIGTNEYPPEYGLDLFVIKINNRFERVAVLQSRKNCNMSRYYTADRLHYKQAIDGFLFSLQFSDNGEPPLKSGSMNGGGIIGVWQGISLQATVKGIRYNVYSPVFLSNGQAYFGSNFPSEGLTGLHTRIPPEINRRDWGTYTFTNGRGILKMPYADIPLRMDGNSLVITANQMDHKFYQLPSVDGARFNGTYVMSEAYGKIPVITFTADGKFIDNGAVKILYHEYIDCINPALMPGSGTYEVKDYTITFNYTDGRKIKIAFLGTEYDKKNQSPAILRMSNNEDPMTRQ